MSNPVLEAIRRRRSIRAYKPDPIPRDVIQQVIEAGNQAPARGRMKEGSTEVDFQPWRFVVVEDASLKAKLIETTLPFWRKMVESMKDSNPDKYEGIMAQYEAMSEPKDMVYYGAPAIVFVIGPTGFDVSCALACENMMIAATSLGLGSCYVGFGAMVTGNTDVVKALELEEGEKIFGPVLLGYPADEAGALASIGAEKLPPPTKWI